MQQIKKIVFIALIALGFASCATHKSSSLRRQTISQKAQVGLTFDQHQFDMACQLKAWKNELIVLSVMPMMGIEMFRLEATMDSVIVVDKLNKRYSAMTYDEINQISPTRISFKYLQNLLKKGEDTISMDFKAGSHIILIKAQLQEPEYNTLKDPQHINLKKYKQVTLRNILPI